MKVVHLAERTSKSCEELNRDACVRALKSAVELIEDDERKSLDQGVVVLVLSEAPMRGGEKEIVVSCGEGGLCEVDDRNPLFALQMGLKHHLDKMRRD